MRDNEPNWGLAFGSGAFLIVWCLGFVANVPFETLLMRATVGAVLGTLLGVVVGYTINGLRALREDLDKDKGGRVDFTVGDDEPLVPAKPDAAAAPKAPAAEDDARELVVPAAEPDPFKPIDFKHAAKQVQSVVQE